MTNKGKKWDTTCHEAKTSCLDVISAKEVDICDEKKDPRKILAFWRVCRISDSLLCESSLHLTEDEVSSVLLSSHARQYAWDRTVRGWPHTTMHTSTIFILRSYRLKLYYFMWPLKTLLHIRCVSLDKIALEKELNLCVRALTPILHTFCKLCAHKGRKKQRITSFLRAEPRETNVILMRRGVMS